MIGLSELILISIIVIILFKPNDYEKIVKILIKFLKKTKEFTNNIKNSLFKNEIINEINDMRDEIITLNGKKYIYGDDKKLHEVFDIETFRADAKIPENENQNN